MAWSRRTRYVVGALVTIVLAIGIGAGVETRSEAHRLLNNPRATRKVPKETPANRQLAYEEVSVTSRDGLHLVGWLLPAPGRPTVVVVHGYKDSRGSVLGVAEILRRHDYAVLVPAIRAHDLSDGEVVGFGTREMADLDAWVSFLRTRADVDTTRLGIFGVSMGGSLVIQFAALNPSIRAVVADCAFSSMADTIDTSVRFFTGLPPRPFAPMMMFWANRELGADLRTIDAKQWIHAISPRPVFLLQGGADVVVSPESGARLLEAAGEPKSLWFEPELGHAQFLAKRPQEFERRVTEFFQRFLSGD